MSLSRSNKMYNTVLLLKYCLLWLNSIQQRMCFIISFTQSSMDSIVTLHTDYYSGTMGRAPDPIFFFFTEGERLHQYLLIVTSN